MSPALVDAPVGRVLTLVAITHRDLADWLKRLGVFPGTILTRHDETMVYYHPMRVRGEHGDVVVPAGLAGKVLVHLDSGERLPLVEMPAGSSGHVETMTCGKGGIKALAKLGLVLDGGLTAIRSLPHMDYLTIINRRRRTRITEGEAAHIWGAIDGQAPSQFYFARQETPFLVEAVLGGRKKMEHLAGHGINAGDTLMLETIEQAKDFHQPGSRAIIFTSPGGLRLYLNRKQARHMIVRDMARDGYR